MGSARPKPVPAAGPKLGRARKTPVAVRAAVEPDRTPIPVGPTPEGLALVRALEALEAGIAARKMSAAPAAAATA